MKQIKEFTPNYITHKEFGEALQNAQKSGVKILAYDCIVTPEALKIDQKIDVVL